MPDYLVACAGFIYIVAFLIINQIVLRCMLLVGSAFYVAYYAVVAGEPLWSAPARLAMAAMSSASSEPASSPM